MKENNQKKVFFDYEPDAWFFKNYTNNTLGASEDCSNKVFVTLLKTDIIISFFH